MSDERERWLVRVLVDREPDEATPCQWDWKALLGGGDPVVLMAAPVGLLPPEVLET